MSDTTDETTSYPAITFHLVPREVWEQAASAPTYLPDAFAADGFIHCTDGEEELMGAGNRYYTADPRAYVVLEIARDRLTSPVKYEDPRRIFPHIYGPLNTDAVVRVRDVVRGDDGRFLSIAP